MHEMKRYPRTQHLQGSRLQHGDEDLSQVSVSEINVPGATIVIEEKVDGANAGISFDDSGQMRLQSRGHFLVGGPRERHWDLFKQWAATHEQELLSVLEDRYIMYGEWLYAKHTVFYDFLPHYFLEFDVFDRQTEKFLSTVARRDLLRNAPVESVLVLQESDRVESIDELTRLVRPSYFKTGNWKHALRSAAESNGVNPDIVERQTDASHDMEGLYIKVEQEGQVIQRLKWVRPSFVNAIADSETHWFDRPIIPNALRPGVNIF